MNERSYPSLICKTGRIAENAVHEWIGVLLFVLLIFMAVHIGISWGTIMNAVRKITGLTSKNRMRTITMRIIAVLTVVYGEETSFEREVGSKLTIYNPCGWYSDESSMSFLVDYLAIMGIYTGGAHYEIQFVRKQEKAKHP